VLNKTDINFLLGVMDKATITGLSANTKMVEVFLKLQKLLEVEDGKEKAATAMKKLMAEEKGATVPEEEPEDVENGESDVNLDE
jgi:hypothetical protein